MRAESEWAGRAEGSGGSSSMLTIPNAITLVRLMCLPVFLWLLFERENEAAAAWLLAVLGMTDWVDGFLARRLGQVSTLGKILDPAVDRLVLVVGILAILIDGAAPLWFGVLALVREVFVSGAGVVLAALGARRIDVTWWGKTGTFMLYFAFPMWLGGASTLSYAPFLDTAAWVFAIPGLMAGLVSVVLYVPAGRDALREGREHRRHGDVPASGAPEPVDPGEPPAGEDPAS
ncbi:MAG: CDP-alcohol phosphatidyltransferase family protein [Actinomycetota bacterium]|nr:CDP-alcohol phosphatidyltransferase family protein [Actinomycetota bacterium]